MENQLRGNEFSHFREVNSTDGQFRLGNALLSRTILAVDGKWPEIQIFADSAGFLKTFLFERQYRSKFQEADFHQPIPGSLIHGKSSPYRSSFATVLRVKSRFLPAMSPLHRIREYKPYIHACARHDTALTS